MVSTFIFNVTPAPCYPSKHALWFLNRVKYKPIFLYTVYAPRYNVSVTSNKAIVFKVGFYLLPEQVLCTLKSPALRVC